MTLTSSYLSISLSILIWACYCAQIPENPCPDYVKFKTVGNKPVVSISVKNDYSGLYNIKVETTLPYPYRIKNGAKLEVRNVKKIKEGNVPKFTFWLTYENVTDFPRIALIVFNGVTICKAGPYPDDVTITTTTYTVKAPIQIQFGNKVRNTRQSDLKLIPRYQCGSVGDNKIGFPWLGVLFVYKIEAKNYEYVCTVTLISDKHAITAANCVQNQNTLNFHVDNLIAVFGKPKMENWVQNSILANVEKVTVHPQLLKSKVGPDLAILTLTQSIFSSKRVQPICLEEQNEDTEENAGVMSGWKSWLNQIETTTPFLVDMKKLDTDECKKVEENLANYTYCAGFKDTKGPCVRNLGVPYTVEKNETFYLKGIATHSSSPKSKSCGNYTIFSDITKEYNWIDSVLISA